VGEGTIVTVLTLTNLAWVAMTELCLVLILVVESLNPVMRSSALVLLGAPFGISKFAELWSVEVIVSTFVFNGVIEVATLVVVWSILPWALDPFEISKVQMLYRKRLPCLVMRLLGNEKDR